ncbi:hypothetical protein Aperf_G00000098196 [Anoplocephala perfoliata]
MYLHFLQTTAYQVINPDRRVRELHRRARSPTRPGSLCDMGTGGSSSSGSGGGINIPGGGRQDLTQSMTPDNLGMGFVGGHFQIYHHSPSPPTFRRVDATDRQRGASVRRPRKDLMVKGLDLLQLGLMFPHDNAVFQQSLNILKSTDSTSTNASTAPPPRYYWYWSNSNSAYSELVWATRTGKDRITAIAHEADYSSLPPSLRRRAKPGDDRSINRRFIGTSDGRIIILDATSGYEVAVHQVHKPSVAVMAISLLPGNQFCLSCGADGRMIVSNLPPLDACIKSPGTSSSFNRSNMGDMNGSSVGGLDDSYFTTIDVDDDGEDEDDAFYDVSGGGGGGAEQSLTFSPPQQPPPMMADVGYVRGEEDTVPNGVSRSNSPVLQEDEFPTYTVAPTVLADLPSSFEIRRNTQISSSLMPRQTTDSGSGEEEGTLQQCIALSPLGTCLLFFESSGTPSPTSATTSTLAELTLRHRQGQEDGSSSHGATPPPIVKQKPLFFTIYSILAQSQAKFTLVKSRELRLPAQLGDRSAQVTVATASISLDDSLIIVGLSNGRLWIYSLDEIGWVVCIASSIPLKANPLYSALISARTPRPTPDRSPLDTHIDYESPKLLDFALADGKPAKACIFIHWPNQSQAPVNPGGWVPPCNPLVAAAIDNLVLVWAFENKLPKSLEDLQNPENIVANSRAQFCLPCPPTTIITALVSQPFGNFCLIAVGLTNGRAVIWSLPERCKIFDICAHGTPVSSIRLSPYVSHRSPTATPTSSPPGLVRAATSDLVAVTTAAEDGVVKAWEFAWPCAKEPPSTIMSPVPSGDCSPARQRSNSATAASEVSCSVRVAAVVRDQPFPLWADLYSVVFGSRGEFYAVGRIKTSCSLQLLFRPPQNTSLDVEESCQTFHCVELSLTTCYRRRPAHSQRLPNILADSATAPRDSISSPAKSSPPSAFQTVNRIVKHSPVPSCAAFSDDMRLLVVGFENGTVHVLQLHCPKDPLRGFKPYRQLSITSKNSLSEPRRDFDRNCSGRPSGACRDLPLDIISSAVKITHLSIWTPPQEFEDPELELVVAVATAGGSIYIWEVRRSMATVTKAETSFEINSMPEVKISPSCQWVRMHHHQHLASSTTATKANPEQTFPLSSLFPTDAEAPPTSAVDRPLIVWFRLFANLEPLQHFDSQKGAPDAWRSRLAWLSAGRDGSVRGRSLRCSMAIDDDSTLGGEDELWALNLVAHKSAEITGVDVDPEGRWLASAASDGAVCVWCLSTERKVFEGSHKPLGVRCVAFRPIATTNEIGTEMLLASGDAGGNLRVWRLTAPKRGDRPMIASRSTLSSDAAGCGGSGFVCLAWSADGGTLAGLSDRLCCWRLITRPSTGGVGGFHHVLDRSRVVRVFDTTDHRNRLFVSSASPGVPFLPSTLIAMEVHSGICFVFDPIEMISSPSTTTLATTTSMPTSAGDGVPGGASVLSDVTSVMLNKSSEE